MNLNYILLQGSRWIRRIIRKKNKVEEIKTKKEIRDISYKKRNKRFYLKC